MSIACPKFYGDDMESPTLVVVAYVGRARKFTVPKRKAPHVKKHMASNVPSNSRKERLEGR